jgi:hypothetical protein
MPHNALLQGDATKMWDDFSKQRPPIHLPYPTASPALVFRCKTDAKYPLDKPKQLPCAPPVEKRCLIKKQIKIKDLSMFKSASARAATVSDGTSDGTSLTLKTLACILKSRK